MGHTAFYPHGKCTVWIPCYSDERPEPTDHLSQLTVNNVPRFVKRLVLKLLGPESFKKTFK